MKTKIIILCCVFYLTSLYAQDLSKIKYDTVMNSKKCYDRKYQLIVYDFAKGIFENSMVKPCYKVPTIFRIKNINPLFYNIRIKADDKVIDYLNTELNEQATQALKNRNS